MATYHLGVSSASMLQVYPEFDYTKEKIQNRSDFKTSTGRMYQYTWGSYTRIDFSLNYVPGSDYALINSWFNSNSDLLFFVVSDSVVEVHSVHFVNDKSPLSQHNEPTDQLWSGKIELETY